MTNARQSESRRCPSCGGHAPVFFEMLGVPARVNFLYPTEKSALESPRGDIVLGLCGECGLVSNLAFDPSLLSYAEGYENPLHCSDVFRSYASDLAAELIRRFDLNGKTVIEIGCGDGDFLRLLCFRGNNRGVGFDPSYSGPADTNGRIRIVRDYYSEKHAGLRADFIYSRHTLEHVQNPVDLLGPLRRSIGEGNNTPVFIEVPNASRILDECFVWDIIYEHTSYFTRGSLTATLAAADFGSVDVREAFRGQFLIGFARPSGGGPPGKMTPEKCRSRDEQSVARFVAGYADTLDRWKLRLDKLRESGRKTVIWGAGSKGITFLNSFDTRSVVESVVDINPRKEGMYIAGTGHRIVSPRGLAGIRPDTVLVVNPVYRDEVDDTLRALGLRPAIETL
jgi:SAM-dependent methyltransferase